MNSVRPLPRDQPSAEETAALYATLRRTVAERRRVCEADLTVRGPGSRRAWVSLEGREARVAITEHGAIVAEGLFDASTLLGALGGTPSFDDLEDIARSTPSDGGISPAPDRSIE